ncbi:hypothetical protein OAJ43_02680 [Nitrosomonadales bacterium]|nr:hypothetical protein [Nitrosomonadales bacterium]
MYSRKNFYMVLAIILALFLLVSLVEEANKKHIEKIHESIR